ncbi:sugar transferase [Fulvivirgaceae bacterium BMA10]|uniref:Sugar transferase n=1 Tax=Splendidivirga corallicola TaxID=3051826 RepID=A0ABT8KIC4_9BACT|nr:sugar transferase [Fulvivirgaceae bacterium BMA10]
MNLPLHKSLVFIHDIFVIIGAEITSYLIYTHYFDDTKEKLGLIVGGALIFVSLLWFIAENNLYKYQVLLYRARQVVAILKALFFSLVTLIFFSFIFKIIEISTSRILIGMIYTNIFLVFLFTRVFLAPAVYFWLVSKNKINRNMLIIGTGEQSVENAKILSENKKSNFKVVGFLDDGFEQSENRSIFNTFPILGGLEKLEKIVEEKKVCDILIASDYKDGDRLHEVITLCKATKKSIHIASDLYNIVNEKLEIEEIGMVSSFRYLPPKKAYFYTIFKRVFDISTTLLIIISFIPLWIFIVFLIKATSSGPIFYKARAIGKDGKEFKMFKFRSMYANASTKMHQDKVVQMIQNNEATKKLQNDPRITPIGRVLRKLSLDEFPQLINVLRGEMSLVGPRPNLPYEFEHMSEWQKRRYTVLPGMTGLWQIKGRDEVLFNDQIILDIYYIEHRSIKLDLEILLNTIPVVIFGKGGL